MRRIAILGWGFVMVGLIGLLTFVSGRFKNPNTYGRATARRECSSGGRVAGGTAAPVGNCLRAECVHEEGGMREVWFESEGVRLFAVEEGVGRVIVMLH